VQQRLLKNASMTFVSRRTLLRWPDKLPGWTDNFAARSEKYMKTLLLALPAFLLFSCGNASAEHVNAPVANDSAKAVSATPDSAYWNADSLIAPAEKHFAHLRQLTYGGDNAEAYWDFAGDKLSFQAHVPRVGRSMRPDLRVQPVH
jgi:hypothetical protein